MFPCGVEREIKEETLSNYTEYQERLREAKMKGELGDRVNTMTKEQILYYESRQQVSVTMHK